MITLGGRKIKGLEGFDYYHLFILVQQSDGAWNIVHHAFPSGNLVSPGILIGKVNGWEPGDVDYNLFNKAPEEDRISISVTFPGNCDGFRKAFDDAKDKINSKELPYQLPVLQRGDNVNNSNAYAYSLLRNAGITTGLYRILYNNTKIIAPGWGHNLL
ncbi:MAG: hypothetical protein IPJ07_11460 [Acidobacteria bacterium]|nr:hypothetical protein [Acidobacteriota bacterium]